MSRRFVLDEWLKMNKNTAVVYNTKNTRLSKDQSKGVFKITTGLNEKDKLLVVNKGYILLELPLCTYSWLSGFSKVLPDVIEGIKGKGRSNDDVEQDPQTKEMIKNLLERLYEGNLLSTIVNQSDIRSD